ncbi:MAG: hypothetical protein K2L16_09435 [Muribaculaceae bacterium]|nr:hypothetical protein [Muribaculaceae bacterium]
MATKRDLKKFIRNSCGALAAEMLMARAAFPEIDRKKTYEIIGDVAALQTRSLGRVNVSFDKDCKAFETPAAYRKARRAYYSAAYDKLVEEFDASMLEIVKKMNAALPENVRVLLKEAAAE